jgi:hypothetical protein
MAEREQAHAGPDSPGGPAVTVETAAVTGAPDEALRDESTERSSRLFYGLGLSLQTFLWFLLFLALVVAIAVGGELTEFRYVGF